MKKRNKASKERVTPPFDAAARLQIEQITDLVKHLARISAENDHERLTDPGKLRYSIREKKGPKND